MYSFVFVRLESGALRKSYGRGFLRRGFECRSHTPVNARALHAPALCLAEDGRETNGMDEDSKGVMLLWHPEVVRLWSRRSNAKFANRGTEGRNEADCRMLHEA
jgi:hypothetical protein